MSQGLEQLARTTSPQPLPDVVCPARFLSGLPDPRGRRGRRFPLIAIVSAAGASVLAGARSLTAIAEWIADAPTGSSPPSALPSTRSARRSPCRISLR
ncbi:transposase family protein [Streptomyces sp. NPDC046924]|uniref:transposase family protein n=1 Tax=Streptomyces sp. NPDC046924 TaxID=3155136 RepID=UPI0033C339DE